MLVRNHVYFEIFVTVPVFSKPSSKKCAPHSEPFATYFSKQSPFTLSFLLCFVCFVLFLL